MRPDFKAHPSLDKMDLTQFAIGQGSLRSKLTGYFKVLISSFLSINMLPHMNRPKNNLLTSNMLCDFSEDTQPTTKIIECKIWAVDCRKGWRRMVTPKGVCDILASHTLKHEMANNTFRKIFENL